MVQLETGMFISRGFDIQNPDSKYFQLSQAAIQKTLEVFTSADFWQTQMLLPSLRRLSRLFDMEPVEVGLKKPDDVLFDLKGMNEKGIVVEDIHKSLRQIQLLCCAYYPLAEYKANKSDADIYFDADEITDIAKFVVDTVVWKTFAFNNADPKENVYELRRKIGGNLKKLREVA